MKINVLTILVILLIVVICLIPIEWKNMEQVADSKSYEERIKEILSDEVEIERKWLIDPTKIPYNLNDCKGETYNIEQTYISFLPEMRVRNINNGEQYTFTMKRNMTKDGLQRDEFDFEIDKNEYLSLLEKKEGNTINKTRYQFLEDNQIIAIDIFHGDLDGLAYMEIEFKDKIESDNYETPDWVIKDVTDDVNYKNGYLARYGIPKE